MDRRDHRSLPGRDRGRGLEVDRRWGIILVALFAPRAADHRPDRSLRRCLWWCPLLAVGLVVGLVAAADHARDSALGEPVSARAAGRAARGRLRATRPAGPGSRRGERGAARPLASPPRSRCRSGSGDRRRRSGRAARRPPRPGHPRAAAARCSPTTRRPSHFSGPGSLPEKRRASSAWPAAERVDAEASLGPHRGERPRASVEAGEHHRRLERERGDRVGGRARGTLRPDRRDHRHPGGVGAERGAKFLRGDSVAGHA